nr:HK97 family phage prohead protease [uncultured Allomuricauda sp.]
MIEYKDFVGSVKDVDRKNRVVTGFLSTFDDVKDSYGDIAVFGMFTKTVIERGPKGKNEIFFLNQHNWAQPHGKFAVLDELQTGLYFESQKLPNTTFSNDAIELYAEEIIKEHSFGYNTIKADYDKEDDVRYLKEVMLHEGSNVTMGANRNTPFTGFKSKEMGFKDLTEKSNRIIKMLRHGTVTDDTMILLEIALKDIQKQAYELGKIKDHSEPSSDTPEPIIETLKEFNNRLITA